MLSFKKVCALSILLASQLQANDWVELQKLTAGDDLGNAMFGYSVAFSADGNTLVVGGPYDNNNQGATWVYRKKTDGWHQEGARLLSLDAHGANIYQGSAVAVSSDGTRLATGGPGDANKIGAAWVFERTLKNGIPVWTQMSPKLVGHNINGTEASQGQALALSGNGKILAVGGPNDGNGLGATWIYMSDGTNWSETQKIVNPDTSMQGCAVTLSNDGSTLAIGALMDNDAKGSVFTYRLMGNTFIQEGDKLIAADPEGPYTALGSSVALSSDGKTLVAGGASDNSHIGAMWIYAYNNNKWEQQGTKKIGSTTLGTAQFGYSVSISNKGDTIFVGGNSDNQLSGAQWKFIKTNAAEWIQDGKKIVAINAGPSRQGCSVALSGDGSIAASGGPIYNSRQGAVWIYGTSENYEPATPRDYYLSYWIPPLATIVAGLITFYLQHLIKKHCCKSEDSSLPTHIRLDDPLVMLEKHRGSIV